MHKKGNARVPEWRAGEEQVDALYFIRSRTLFFLRAAVTSVSLPAGGAEVVLGALPLPDPRLVWTSTAFLTGVGAWSDCHRLYKFTQPPTSRGLHVMSTWLVASGETSEPIPRALAQPARAQTQRGSGEGTISLPTTRIPPPALLFRTAPPSRSPPPS